MPLNEELLNSDLIISSAVNLIPGLKGPGYGGESNTMKNSISAKTATMTRSAMQMPRQLRSLGAMETSSWKREKFKLARYIERYRFM